MLLALCSYPFVLLAPMTGDNDADPITSYHLQFARTLIRHTLRYYAAG